MSVGLIQGGNGGMGKAFIKYLLLNTKLNVIATSRSPSLLKESLELELEDIDHSRLSILEMNLLNEDSIASVAKNILDNHGKANLKLLINCSGVLHPDRSITQVDYNELLHQYQINTFGHLLSLKHFVPLLPKTADIRKSKERNDVDLSNGTIMPGLSVLASLTARVGSIGDNKKGGWIGYRSSKAATNQISTTLQRELTMRSTPAISVALHPGTIPGTGISSKFTKLEDADIKPGHFTPEESARLLMEVIKGLKPADGGRFLDYAGKDILF